MQGQGNWVGGLVLVFLGVVFLLVNLGVLPWSVWGTLWRLWPIILIISGVQMLGGRGWMSGLLGCLLGLVLVGALFWWVAWGRTQLGNRSVWDTFNHNRTNLKEYYLPD